MKEFAKLFRLHCYSGQIRLKIFEFKVVVNEQYFWSFSKWRPITSYSGWFIPIYGSTYIPGGRVAEIGYKTGVDKDEWDAYFESVELAGVMSVGSATNKKGARL